MFTKEQAEEIRKAQRKESLIAFGVAMGITIITLGSGLLFIKLYW